ncbi:MAG: hypothetical protein DRZ90_03105 [Spirochaetes bacterium]|nr:MAG: hypothetical protein DRP49_05600 [Spirochaetota bacterium]RKX76960.1 MAG: hypothetical protein DRP60_06970 [Spirochaetota bacterium]RKX98365.1 MAG: hypothetical protein DRZ90_03105 [Spirochaetota bacterium]
MCLKPGILSGAVLLLLSAQVLPGLELSLDAEIRDDYAVVSGYIDGFDSGELLRQLDSGGTARLIWVFRLGGLDETLVRYVHRDFLDTGYIVFSPGIISDDIFIPAGEDSLEETLSTLNDYELTALGQWEKEDTLECRIFLDLNMFIPPLSIWSLFRKNQDRSPWTSIPYPQVETK